MACLSLILFCLACFAGDVVELEPVRALSFHCSRLKNTLLPDGGLDQCQKNPYCYWRNTDCIDDPCILQSKGVLVSMTDTCEDVASSSNCHQRDISASVLNHDCSGSTPNTGFLCVTTQVPAAGESAKAFDYCAYAYIRDQKCPESICKTADDEVGCVPNNQQQCTMLSEKDCKLVPKCYWKSSTCLQDPCFKGSADKTCSNWPGSDPDPNKAVPLGDCVDFKPLRTGTTSIQLYCLHKNNTNPNICYFAGKNDSSTDVDYGITYPTYVAGAGGKNPTCEGQISTCDGTGTCYTTINTGGALAGQYCTDGTHGSANILRIPSMLVFLVISALSLFIL